MIDEPQEPDLFLKCLLEANVDGIIAFDRDYRYTTWNRAMERISGVKRGEVLGKTLSICSRVSKKQVKTDITLKLSPAKALWRRTALTLSRSLVAADSSTATIRRDTVKPVKSSAASHHSRRY